MHRSVWIHPCFKGGKSFISIVVMEDLNSNGEKIYEAVIGSVNEKTEYKIALILIHIVYKNKYW